jgi:hypothetical protein
METNLTEIKVKGKPTKVPSTRINDKTVVVIGKWLKTAEVHDEEWLEGEVVDDPELFITVGKQKLKADIFTFTQKLPHTEPRHKYHMEWDNVAAVRTTSYKDWWEKQLPQVTRKSVRRGAKRGVTARIVEFDDELVRGMVGIHEDTLVKQGMPFAHRGQGFEAVKQHYGTYRDRSEFLGAFYEGELIGIIKLVYVGPTASIMAIVTKNQHYDKRPTNVLIAKAVEVCEAKGLAFLIYGKYIYGNKTDSSLTEFKRRNGFEQIDFPRYYVPLTLKGRVAIKLKLHLGLLGILPAGAISRLLKLRAGYYRAKLLLFRQEGKPQHQDQDGGRADAEGEGD